MDTAQKLLRRVRRKQLLVCAYQPERADGGTLPAVGDITTWLDMPAAECLPLLNRLQTKGLIEPVPDAGPGAVRLTSKGQRLVERMSRAEGRADGEAAAVPAAGAADAPKPLRLVAAM
jgi:hypothetical protein